MRELLVIGVGAGDPDHVTMQAVQALHTVDVFFVLDKGPATADLTEARRQILERFARPERHREVLVADPPRDRAATDYPDAVRLWRDARAELLERVLRAELADGGRGGFLVWGDPSLYDGTIRVLDTIVARGVLPLEYQVIPGISSVQALAARHRVTLNRVAGAVHVTTGRRLADGLPEGVDDLVVMLDARFAAKAYRDQQIDIYWGAYLGTPDEVLISGRLGEVVDRIERTRNELRERKGWIMDTYLIRRNP
ncbi:precorrin-6A synthase (deacetylating) [Micromonospora sp. NPDC050397]|uniref:precorrin-6A synthase (deacetylating) n=1 Tax=Micromonospora sp. NPDC050397 TaxID=3364279 RepID=UPI00384D7BE2